MWTVPARRRRLSAICAANRRRRADGIVADGERGPVILGVENPAWASWGGRDSRSSGRRCSCGRGRRGRRARIRRRRRVLHRFRQGRLPTYVAVIAAVGAVAVTIVRGDVVAATALAHHVHEELGPGELADLRGAKGLMETRKRLLRDGLLLQLKSLARVPGLALLLVRNRVFLWLKSARL